MAEPLPEGASSPDPVIPEDFEQSWTPSTRRGYDRRVAAAESSRERHPRSRSTVRAALAAGFTIVFALWVLWGYQLFRGLQQIEESVSRVHDAYLRGEQTLSKLRTNVLFGSIYLRDALVDGALNRRPLYRAELTRLRQEAEGLLNAYVPEVESQTERDHWALLQLELGKYWSSREVAFIEPPLTQAQAAAMLGGRAAPQRDTVLQVMDQLLALQTAAGHRQQEALSLLYRDVRTRLLLMGAGTLLVALGAAVVASRRVNWLQREIERQRRIEQSNREDLERLSARLVSVQEQERGALARELHDEVGQALTAVKMDIGIALRADLDSRVRNALEESRDISESTLRSVRDMSQLLHPSILDDFGLPATLTTYLRNFSRRTGIRAQLAETMEARLASEIELCVYRIVQEALNNVAQHSGATACTVTLNAGDGLLRLVIEDNGQGVGSAVSRVTAGRGLGFIGMRERAQSLGGSFMVNDRDGGGATVVVRLPLSGTAASDDSQEMDVRRAG
jgi:signal transduction histidine kinase